MSRFADHLVVIPILLPLLAGAIMLVLGGERRRNVNAAINVFASLSLLLVALAMIRIVDANPAGVTAVYRLGDWPAPFAIVLVMDRLAALMVLLTSLLAIAAVVFSLARWHRVGVLFHPLFQFLLMGVNGSFLTGDLFNLFVFFEVLLAASYGLALHGSGVARVSAGMHYIVINLAASLLFLIGVSLIYGIAGTLNMADLAARIPAIPVEDRAFSEAGAGILGVAFLKGGDVADVFLASRYVCRCTAAGCSDVRYPYEGGCVRRAPPLAAFVRACSISAAGSRVVVMGRDGNHLVWNNRRACVAGYGASRGVFRARILRYGACRNRVGATGNNRGRAFLPGQFDTWPQRFFPADRTGGKRTRARS